MDKELIHLAVQIPVVITFVWFVLHYQKAFHKYLETRNTQSEAAQQRVADALIKVADQLGENEKILERIRERVGD